MNTVPRGEYPRPDFKRDNWLSLNGEWEFSFSEPAFDKKIVVPYACETRLSGIGDKDFHRTVWYKKPFTLPAAMRGREILLHFGAVDYQCRVWVNGVPVCEHTGGQVGFCADITDALSDSGENIITVRADDDYTDMEMPRGKQFWERESRSIFYSRTTGIWQSVWLEAVHRVHLKNCFITPLFDARSVQFEYELSESENASLETVITFGQALAARICVKAVNKSGSFSVQLDREAISAWNFAECAAWTPETPRLFDVEFHVYRDGELCDCVKSYFGMRKISFDNGVFMLNNRPYYQKLVLDQGYWEPSLMTAPTDGDFVRDINLVKAMGFNGVRKHQKVEDPRFLYHADRLGLLVWGEIGASYVFSRESALRLYNEWQEILKRDYNHPCIVAWTPLNESWGVQEIARDKKQQAHANSLVQLLKSLDDTRAVIDNDGWEHTCGDLLTVHDYASEGDVLGRHFESLSKILALRPGGRQLFAQGYGYRGQPILVTEFGGIRFAPDTAVANSWGYCDADSKDTFLERLSSLVKALKSSKHVQGYCYTQLTDIETEENGLLNYDRSPKAPLEEIRKINEG